VFETEETYQVKVELGGMEREGISVTVEDRILLIRGRRCDSSPPNKIRYRQAEIKYGAFEVRLALPDDVDFDGISAVYGNGFLDAVLPKRPSTGLQSTRVTIQIG
jgi:HSP20 family protein